MDWIAAHATIVLTVLAVTGLLLLSAFFSGSETALTAASRGVLKAQADKGSKGAKAALEVTDDSERMIGALLLGNNVANILSASLTTALLTDLFGSNGVAGHIQIDVRKKSELPKRHRAGGKPKGRPGSWPMGRYRAGK